MKKSLRLLQFTIGLFSVLAMSACGGGGGGGETAITYTGKTTQTTVTSGNSGKLMSNIQDFGGGLDDAALLKPSENNLSSRPYLQVYDLVQRLQTAMSDQNGHFSPNKPVSLNETEAGPCGGEITTKGTVDDVTGDVDLAVEFSQFCEDGTTISGTMTANGNVDSLTMTITGLTVAETSGSITIEGSIVVDGISLSQITMTMNVVVRDNISKKTFKIENYRVTTTQSSTGTTISLSGRFFNPDEGFVDLTTPTPLFVATGNEFPSSGVLEATGSNGTKVRLTALSATQFQLEVDADGNGTFELVAIGLWKNLETTTPVSPPVPPKLPHALNIINGSFETADPFTVFSIGGNFNTTVTSWTATQPTGTFSPSTPGNTFGFDVFTQDVPDGLNTVFANGNGGVSQVLTDLLTENCVYDLKVEVGDRIFMNLPDTHSLELRAGGVLLASATVTPGNGTFATLSLQYTTKAGDPFGSPLEVHLVTTHSSSANDTVQISWDNVRGTVTPN